MHWANKHAVGKEVDGWGPINPSNFTCETELTDSLILALLACFHLRLRTVPPG